MIASRAFFVVPVMVLGLAFLLLTPAAQATVYYWTGPNGTWDTSAAANWSLSTNGSSPLNWPGAGDADFYSNGQTTTTVTVNNTQTVGNITFDGSGYTLSGGSLNLTAGTITANQSATIGSVIGGATNLTKAGARPDSHRRRHLQRLDHHQRRHAAGGQRRHRRPRIDQRHQRRAR